MSVPAVGTVGFGAATTTTEEECRQPCLGDDQATRGPMPSNDDEVLCYTHGHAPSNTLNRRSVKGAAATGRASAGWPDGDTPETLGTVSPADAVYRSHSNDDDGFFSGLFRAPPRLPARAVSRSTLVISAP